MAKVREKLLDMENGLCVWLVHIDYLRERDKNARVMSPDKFERLQTNIKADRKLESLPLVMKKNDRDEFEIISGHHRVRAARGAGINEIYVLSYDKELSRDDVKSKQLAHNSLVGVDDEQILREIYLEIESLNARIATGLKYLEAPLEVGAVNLDEVVVDMDYELLNIIFLPREKKRFDDAITMVEKKANIMVEKLESFEPFKAAIRQVGFKEDIRNISCILGKMAEIVVDYYKLIQERKNDDG